VPLKDYDGDIKKIYYKDKYIIKINYHVFLCVCKMPLDFDPSLPPQHSECAYLFYQASMLTTINVHTLCTDARTDVHLYAHMDAYTTPHFDMHTDVHADAPCDAQTNTPTRVPTLPHDIEHVKLVARGDSDSDRELLTSATGINGMVDSCAH
jgi:hypothetical protein